MNRFFLEEYDDSIYKIAAFDIHRIFNATNPGTLATVYECSSTNPTRDDDAQIFYALCPSIGADDIMSDLYKPYKSNRLNSWSIMINDKSYTDRNIFNAVARPSYDDLLLLYNEKYTITPDANPLESFNCIKNVNNINALLDASNSNNWKNGILQRCFDCLVFHKYRGKCEMYALLDFYYRYVMRFKWETEYDPIPPFNMGFLFSFVKHITLNLGLKNTHDDTQKFSALPTSVNSYLNLIYQSVPQLGNRSDDHVADLSKFLSIWSGSKIIKTNDEYKIKVNANIRKALSYLQPLLLRPGKLKILEEPM